MMLERELPGDGLPPKIIPWLLSLAVVASGCAPRLGDRSARSPAGASLPTTNLDSPGNNTPASPSPPPRAATSTAPRPEASYWAGRRDLIAAPAPPHAVELALPPVERSTLDNGLEVMMVAKTTLPIVSFSIAVKAGSYDEQRDGNQSVADFVAAMLRKGTRTRTADQISRAIDFVGGALDGGAGAEHSTLTCSALAKDATLCLDLMADVLLRPTFPESEIAEVRDQMLAGLAARSDDPHLLAADQLDNLIFGDAHPDGWYLLPRHIQAITREKMQTFWSTFYRPNNALLAIAGSFDPVKMRAAVRSAFSGWAAAPIPPRPHFQIPAPQPTRIVLIDKADLTQATLMFGHGGIRHADPDWYAATLANYVLGGSDFSSRLMIEVRSKRGLTYGIGSSFGASLYAGAFRVSAATRNETVGEAFAVSVAEMRRMKNDGPTVDELAKAKGYYAGSTPLGLESASELAGSLVLAELHGLGTNYVRRLALALSAVTEAEAKAAAARWLHPDTLSVVLVGKAAAIVPQLDAAHLPYRLVDYASLATRGQAR
jgi:zinc protease